MAAATRPDARSPRFRRDPFVRDGVFDLGRATAPRMTAPHMLPSATLKASAPTTLLLTRLNSPPHTIAVYASPWSSPSRTQHSLPGGCYPLPGPDFHRLDRARLPGALMTQFAPYVILPRQRSGSRPAQTHMIPPQSTGWFDCHGAAGAIYRCPSRPRGRPCVHNYPESGECRWKSIGARIGL